MGVGYSLKKHLTNSVVYTYPHTKHVSVKPPVIYPFWGAERDKSPNR